MSWEKSRDTNQRPLGASLYLAWLDFQRKWCAKFHLEVCGWKLGYSVLYASFFFHKVLQTFKEISIFGKKEKYKVSVLTHSCLCRLLRASSLGHGAPIRGGAATPRRRCTWIRERVGPFGRTVRVEFIAGIHGTRRPLYELIISRGRETEGARRRNWGSTRKNRTKLRKSGRRPYFGANPNENRARRTWDDSRRLLFTVSSAASRSWCRLQELSTVVRPRPPQRSCLVPATLRGRAAAALGLADWIFKSVLTRLSRRKILVKGRVDPWWSCRGSRRCLSSLCRSCDIEVVPRVLSCSFQGHAPWSSVNHTIYTAETRCLMHEQKEEFTETGRICVRRVCSRA